MLKRLFTIISLVALGCCAALADDSKTVTVQGESTFYALPVHSLADAKRLALEQARIAALAKEFGTNVSQDVYQRELVDGRTETTYYNQLNRTEVKGEWIADIGEPAYKVDLDNEGLYIVNCKVKGTARALSNQGVDFLAKVLRNGTDDKYADTRFKHNDQLRLHARFPVDGYLLVYLVGEDGDTYSLLPYSAANEAVARVKRNKDYIFFDADRRDPQFGEPDELVMTLTSGRSVETNQLYVLFSPEPFNKAVDNGSNGLLPRELATDDFHKWLGDVRRRDPKMSMKVMVLSIEN